MLHRVAGQYRMVCLYVQLEVIEQVVLSEEVEASGGVRVVLMLGRFLWLGFDVELTLESYFLLKVYREVKQAGQVVEFPL